MLIRRLARPMLSAIFIFGGINTLRDAPNHAKAAEPLLDKARPAVDALPAQVPTDPQTLVRIDGAVKVGAGAMLALGKFPRLSSLLLAGSIVPTTLAAHAYWEYEDPQERAAQQVHFMKNLGLLGGLLLASVDTGGKPSVGHRAKVKAEKAKKKAAKSAAKGKAAAKAKK
ncbi:DoxX family protein [Saccharopolyspora griseoalba]|uniref:DoxX family protein n=1 Tax=Saccharopolyspora griseoalba TaxID=1431848 RepID=A0ABW2LLS4_9PSEU